jgi:hypothetical protein
MGCFCEPDVMSTEEREGISKLDRINFYFSTNQDENYKIKKRIVHENLELGPLLKAKIDELIEKRNKSKPEEIARGNCCRNPCYEYNPSLITECPKCGGKVEESYENGYTTERRYDRWDGCYKNVNIYDDNVCDKFKFNDKISKEDYDLKEFFNYFKKKEKLEGEKFREYLIIDGERFDAPTSTSLEIFFKLNEETWFPQGKIPEQNWTNTSFFIEGNREELGQALGYYGYAWKHYVFIYRCLLCGLKYHIMRTSPFRFRDKTKDNKITVIKKVNQENQETQENQVTK